MTDPVMLAFWDCGHVEVDDGSPHECDGRDVCTATYRPFVPAGEHEYRVRWQRAGRARHKGSILQTRKGAREKYRRLLEFEEVKLTDDFWSAYGDMPDIVDATIEVRDVGAWRVVEHEERRIVHECETCGFAAVETLWVEGDGCPRCMRKAERDRISSGDRSVPDDDIPF